MIMENKKTRVTDYLFKVETIEAGQRQSYGDSYYHYIVTSTLSKHIVRDFCMKVLKRSWPKADMPNPFAGELQLFKLAEDQYVDAKEGIRYVYKCKSLYTG